DGTTFWNNQEMPVGWEDQPNKPHPITWKRADWPQPKWKGTPERSPWPARGSPLVFAYPEGLDYAANHRQELTVDPDPADGPPNTVKITLRGGAPNSPSESRYWIDPQRSHMI